MKTYRSGKTSSKVLAASLALAAGLALAAPTPSVGHDGKSHNSAQPPSPGDTKLEGTAKVALLDLELLDTEGKPLRFASEAVGDRIVAIDFVYTTCTTICPIVSAVMAQVQDQLSERLGAEVLLISLSIDPVRDTPKRLGDYARKFEAGPGWLWLTGPKNHVDQVLIDLGAYTADVVDHPPMLVIGDPKRSDWSRIIGLPSPDDVVARLEALLAARQENKTTLRVGD